jgi:thiol-disulfide isomerase/thioredoxin
MRYWNSLLIHRSLAYAAACVALGLACSNPRVATRAPDRVEPVPEVRLLGPGRRLTTVGELRRGRPALISVWATWCDTCTGELASLNRLQRRVGNTALVVGIAEGEAYEHVTDFVGRMGVTYPQLIDEELSFSAATGTRSLPALLITDREGRVRHRGEELNADALEAFRIVLEAPR